MTLETAKSAIAAMQNPAQTAAANEWLVRFERTTDAWQIADLLISEPAAAPQYRFWGAIMLYNKCQRDLDQITPDIVPGLMQNIIQHIIRLSSEVPLDSKACQYLCLSVASLALQINQAGVVHQILMWLNPIMQSCPQILLHLLMVLPEECDNYKIAVSRETRGVFRDQLSATGQDMVGFLIYLRGQPTTLETNNKILRCLTEWIRHSDISAGTISTSEIFPFVLGSLGSLDVLESAVDTCTAMWDRYGCSDAAIAGALYPEVLVLKQLWDMKVHELKQDPDDDDCVNVLRYISKLVAATAEACLPLIAGDQGAQHSDLLTFVTTCASCSDYSVARVQAYFFYEASFVVRKCRDPRFVLDHPRLESLTVSAHAGQLLLPYFGTYLESSVTRMCLRDAIIIGGEKMTDEEEDLRVEMYDQAIDCADAMDASLCVQHVCGMLQKEIQAAGSSGRTVSYSLVESMLKTISLIANHLTEADNPMIEQLMSFINSLPEVPGMQDTINRFMGKCSRWLAENPATLTPILSRLFNGLTNPSTLRASAAAIKNILSGCAGRVEVPIQELMAAATALRNGGALPLEADIELLDGFTYVISRLPPEHHQQGATQLLEPIIQRLTAALDGPSTDAKALGTDIDRLTTIVRYLRVDSGLLLQIFSQLFPLLQAALDKAPAESVCEKVCRCYKHFMRNTNSTDFGPVIPFLSSHLAAAYAKIPVAAFLYAGSICVKEFSKVGDGVHVAQLMAMVWTMSTSFFAQFTSLESFAERPDVVEEYFYLLSRVIQYCPGPLLAAEGVDTFIQAGVTGLQLQHKDAQKGILSFFENLVDVPRRNKELEGPARAIIGKWSPSIVQAIVRGLAGEIPLYAIGEGEGSIRDVLWSLRQLAEATFQEQLAIALTAAPETARVVADRMNLVVTLCRCASRGDFKEVLVQFEARCTKK